MKFGAFYKRNQIPEWSTRYVAFQNLKEELAKTMAACSELLREALARADDAAQQVNGSSEPSSVTSDPTAPGAGNASVSLSFGTLESAAADMSELSAAVAAAVAEGPAVATERAPVPGSSSREKTRELLIHVQLDEVEAFQEFRSTLLSSLDTVSAFYAERAAALLSAVEALIVQLLVQGRLSEYEPGSVAPPSRLARMIERDVEREAEGQDDDEMEVFHRLEFVPGNANIPLIRVREADPHSSDLGTDTDGGGYRSRSEGPTRSGTPGLEDDGGVRMDSLSTDPPVIRRTRPRRRKPRRPKQRTEQVMRPLDLTAGRVPREDEERALIRRVQSGRAPEFQPVRALGGDDGDSQDPKSLDALSLTFRIANEERGKGDDLLTSKVRDEAAPEVESTVAEYDVKAAFREVYRGIILLEQYCSMNLQACHKILKKVDKQLGTRFQKPTMDEIGHCPFAKHKALKELKSEVELLYARCFTEGHRSDAMADLRVPVKKPSVGLAIFTSGLFMGATFSVAIFIIFLRIIAFDSDTPMQYARELLIIFRAMFAVLWLVWLWAFDMYVWNRFRVNYAFILEFNVRRHIRYQQLLDAAAAGSLILVSATAIYLLSNVDYPMSFPPSITWLAGVDQRLLPFFVFAAILLFFLRLQLRSDWWVTQTVWRIVRAPFVAVAFRDFFFCDQLVSLSIVLGDLNFTLCFYGYGADAWTENDVCFDINTYARPLLAVLPSLWRFLQCLRRFNDSGRTDMWQLVNAGKYSMAFFITIFSIARIAAPNNVPLTVFWVISLTVGALYGFWWDVYKDWGLGDPKHGYLREKLTYPRAAYYAMIVLDVFGRFSWSLTLVPALPQFSGIEADVQTTIVALVEIFRRSCWNLFRMENEQLSNAGKFRVINMNPLPSLESHEGGAAADVDDDEGGD